MRAIDALNGRYHRAASLTFLVVVVAHWAEHLTQAYQIWVLGRSVPQSRGVLGQFFPWLVKSEWLHYGYAIVMLIGLFVLRKGFVGRAGKWWRAALYIQVWHHLEHLILLLQALTGAYLLGRALPTSFLQLLFPRVELHLFYNAAVFLPMLVAMYLHIRPRQIEVGSMPCTCAQVRPATV